MDQRKNSAAPASLLRGFQLIVEFITKADDQGQATAYTTFKGPHAVHSTIFMFLYIFVPGCFCCNHFGAVTTKK